MAWKLPRRYAYFLSRTLDLRACWPVANPLEPGDYGRIKDGYFSRLGHVGEWGLKPHLQAGGSMDVEVASQKVRVTQVHAGTTVEDLAKATSGKGELRIDFQAKHSFLLRAKGCKSKRIRDPKRFGQRLAKEVAEWRHSRWLLVEQVWSAPSCLVLGSSKAGNSVTFRGDVKALRDVLDGHVGAGVAHKGTASLALHIVGGTGPLLFRAAYVRSDGTIA